MENTQWLSDRLTSALWSGVASASFTVKPHSEGLKPASVLLLKVSTAASVC